MTAGHTADPFSPEALDSLWRSGALITDVPGHNAWDREATRAKLIEGRNPEAAAASKPSTAQTVDGIKAERAKALAFIERADEVIAANTTVTPAQVAGALEDGDDFYGVDEDDQ